MKKPFVRKISPADFERMRIIARANDLRLTTDSEVFRIIYLGEMFRDILRLSEISLRKGGREDSLELTKAPPEKMRPKALIFKPSKAIVLRSKNYASRLLR